MKQFIDKIKKFCKEHRVITCLIAAAFLVVVTVSIVVPVTVSNGRNLDSIEVISLPTKTEYSERQTLNTEGLRVFARYKNGKSEEVFEYIVDKTDLALGNNEVKISYTHKKATKTASFTVVVSERRLTEIQITKQPNTLIYSERTYFNPTGLEIMAVYDNEEKELVTGYYFDKAGALQIEDTSVTVTYVDKNVAKTATIDITVNPRQVNRIELVSEPTKLSYVEGAQFDPSGLVVKAYFDNGEEAFVSDWDYDKKDALAITDTSVTITYGEQSETVTISVGQKILSTIMVNALPQKIAYYEGEYFDFLGLEIFATYENHASEIVSGWEYDKKSKLTASDTQVIISYTLHGVTKTFSLGIVIISQPEQNDEQKLIDEVLNLLRPIEEMTESDLYAIDYALNLLDNAQQLTAWQQSMKEALETKKQEILDNIEPEPEPEYRLEYAIAGDLLFGDIVYGGNPLTYKASDDIILMSDATSEIARQQGYYFAGWQLNGVTITALENISQDSVIYAVFQLTATANITFIDYDDKTTELAELVGIIRTAAYDFESNSIAQLIYSTRGILTIAYYSTEATRIFTADLSTDANVVIYVKTVLSREIHLQNADSVTLSWSVEYSDENGVQQAVKAPSVGTVFVVPVDATVTMISMHANIDDILIDGESKGESVSNSIVQAVFVLTNGEHAVSVTFTTILKDVTTISFVGNNQTEYIYPSDWNGILAGVDMETLSFVFDEANMNYLNVYTIEGLSLYFEDLLSYEFSGNTTVWVTRIANRFTFTVIYENGTESFNNLVGRQSLESALSGYTAAALELINEILADDSLYIDAGFQNTISAADILAMILRDDITIYSDWSEPLPPKPEEPVFDPVDYTEYSFIGEWNSLFNDGGDILSSGLVLSADGTYFYETYINGIQSVEISGVYRIENDIVVIKMLNYQYAYDILTIDNLTIDISFAADGLMSVSFIQLSGSSVMVFEHTMTAKNVRPANYYGRDFIGVHDYEGSTIELIANGTAIITNHDTAEVVHYRVTDDNSIYIFSNGNFGTVVIDLLGGDAQ